MDRLILTMVTDEKHRSATPFLLTKELNYRYKYEVWFDTEENEWVSRAIPRKIGRNNRVCEVK